MSVKCEGERQLKKHCHPTQSSPAAKRRKLQELHQEKSPEKEERRLRKEGQVLTEEDGEGSSENAECPLLFFFDVETTGLNIYQDHIIKLAAKVIETPPSGCVTKATFSALVHTSRSIPSRVTELTGISSNMLSNKPSFSTVFRKFLQWIIKTKQEVSKHTGIQHLPVLVAHNGFGFDVPLMLAEIERRPDVLKTSDFVRENIHFSDTFHHLRQTKKNGHSAFKDVKKFGLKDLYQHFVPDGSFSGHRALCDVEALEEIFSCRSIASLLSSLPRRPAQEQLQMWKDQKEKYILKRSLKDKITDPQAKRLVELKLPYPELRCIWKVCEDDAKFDSRLCQKGVRSKELREKLRSHFSVRETEE